MKHRFTILLMMTFYALSLMAYDYDYLVFSDNQGTLTAMSVENLTLSIHGSELLVSNGNQTATFALSELAYMQFSVDGTLTSIDNITPDNCHVDIYSPSGIKIGSYDNLGQALPELQTGVYVVVSGNKSQKIVVK
ncbi:MAG TPA: hypothetical protein DEO38_03640 [Bacteroidales bacterium]|nr:hypothetical protein [Bacteroidales bacterium]